MSTATPQFDAIAGNPIRIGGDGTPYRSYLYAADLAIWLWTLLFKGISLRPYNVGSAEDHSISELAHIVTSALAPELPVEIAKKAAPGSAPSRYVPEVSRAYKELGLTEKIPLQDALKRTADWLRSCRTLSH